MSELEAAALEQIEGVIRQTTGFLHRNLYALLAGIHVLVPQCELIVIAAAIQGGLVATEPIGQETGHAANGCHAHARQVVDATVGQALLQKFNHMPAIDEGLQFRGCAQVSKEIATFGDCLERNDGAKQRVFVTCLLALAVVAIGFHSCINVLTCYYANTLRSLMQAIFGRAVSC